MQLEHLPGHMYTYLKLDYNMHRHKCGYVLQKGGCINNISSYMLASLWWYFLLLLSKYEQNLINRNCSSIKVFIPVFGARYNRPQQWWGQIVLKTIPHTLETVLMEPQLISWQSCFLFSREAWLIGCWKLFIYIYFFFFSLRIFFIPQQTFWHIWAVKA